MIVVLFSSLKFSKKAESSRTVVEHMLSAEFDLLFCCLDIIKVPINECTRLQLPFILVNRYFLIKNEMLITTLYLTVPHQSRSANIKPGPR